MKINATLLEQAKNEYRKIYGYATNGDMILLSWSIKSIGAVVELSNNLLYVISKPDIKTRFLFGYGKNGVADEQSLKTANDSADAIKTKENFIKANLDEFDNATRSLTVNQDVYYYRRGHSGKEPSRIIGIVEGKGECTGVVPKEDIASIRIELAKVRKDFEKRLETYWKKYGSSKLKIETYLRNF